MKRALLLLTLLSGLGACGTSSSDGTTTYDPAVVTTTDGFCAALMDAMCSNTVACGEFATKDACLAATDVRMAKNGCLLSTRPMESALNAGAFTVDGEALAACLEGLGASCAGSGYCLQDAATGPKKAGEACAQDAECRPSGFCDGLDSACPGTCRAYALTGEACSDPSRCADELFCAKDGKCAPRPEAGQPCGEGHACAEGLDCNEGTCHTREELLSSCAHGAGEWCVVSGGSCSSSSLGDMKCNVTFSLYLGLGASCDPSSNEDGELADGAMARRCQGELVCDGDTKKCVAPLAAGTACQGKEWMCGTAQLCDAATHTCTDLPAEGKACDKACAPPFACVEGTCKAPQAAGAACTGSSQCDSGRCRDGKCAPICVVK